MVAETKKLELHTFNDDSNQIRPFSYSLRCISTAKKTPYDHQP